MGFWDTIKDQFLDVIEYEDESNKLLVMKFNRESGNNELKQGSKVIEIMPVSRRLDLLSDAGNPPWKLP